MKNEDRIVELLAENLIKQDQQAELLGKVVDTLGVMGNTLGVMGNTLGTVSSTLGTMSGTLNKHSGLLQTIVTKLGILTEHEKRIIRLENKVFKK